MCHVQIDPAIAKRIMMNEKYPVRVFIQLEADCKGVYVTNKSTTGFDVIELMGGSSDAGFSWSLTANVKDDNLTGSASEPRNPGVRSTEYRIRE
jgi:hypothetical protein